MSATFTSVVTEPRSRATVRNMAEAKQSGRVTVTARFPYTEVKLTDNWTFGPEPTQVSADQVEDIKATAKAQHVPESALVFSPVENEAKES